MNLPTRRQFHSSLALGAGALAMGSLPAASLLADDADLPLHPSARRPATARSVILLFMSGGPSQVDTFDPKPDLASLAGKDVPESLAKRVPRIKRAGLKNLMASPWKFRKHGESGLTVSELLPHTAKHADKLCVIRTMTHRNPVHGPGECVALTGTGTGTRPSLGAWSLYGLGRASQNLPSYVAMNLHTDGMQYPQAAGWGSGFLPAGFQGTVVDAETGIRNVKLPKGVSRQRRGRELATIQFLNQRFLDQVKGNSELAARIRSYDLVDDLQRAAPELFELSSESKQTRGMYGLDAANTEKVGRACLLARRMVERGVRFIQVRVGGWDAHGNIKGNHEKLAARTDQPIAGLLSDLKHRGLLDSTLVLWCGEFGRTPTMEGRGRGRDHSPAAYSVWLAGGGVRGGQVIGETDPIGYTVVDRPVKPQDLHATILRAIGLNADKLFYDHHGLQETPLGVTGGAAVREAFFNDDER